MCMSRSVFVLHQIYEMVVTQLEAHCRKLDLYGTWLVSSYSRTTDENVVRFITHRFIITLFSNMDEIRSQTNLRAYWCFFLLFFCFVFIHYTRYTHCKVLRVCTKRIANRVLMLCSLACSCVACNLNSMHALADWLTLAEMVSHRHHTPTTSTFDRIDI